MKNPCRGLIPILVGVCLLLPIGLRAQEQGSSQEGSSSTTNKKETKKRQKKLTKELGPGHEPWVKDEVVDIITDEEKRAFSELATNEEREQFIEDFWDRRNPDKESPTNSFKEEHYRRLAYADEHFASGISGRKTDRGRIYIIWGPPDEIESHPTRGTYDRPMEQGGGSTTTHPWELWRYRHLEGIGENIEIEFVDPTGSGEYHITMDPCEKDALAHVPGAALSLSEMLGRSAQAGRYSNSNGTTCPMAIGGISANANEFENLYRYFTVQRAPKHFRDLEEQVSSRMLANQLPFEYHADFLRATGNTDLVPISVQLRNRDLSYKNNQGVQSAVLEVYGRITSPGGRLVQTFEDVISHDIPQSLFESSKRLYSVYQKALPLRAGLYRLDI
jgi:GWxTD domain-containing protein